MSQSSKRIYMDVSALCRPFDDQAQMRIRLETDAVQLILSHVRSGHLALIVSPAHQVEIEAIDDLTERGHLEVLLQQVGQHVKFDLGLARKRAEQLAQRGLGVADAAHLAFAEEARAEFITCDDRLLRRCRRLQPAVWCGAPVSFCEKEQLR